MGMVEDKEGKDVGNIRKKSLAKELFIFRHKDADTIVD